MKHAVNEDVLKARYSALLGQDLVKVLAVRGANHKPHPFMIGPAHIKHAADNCGHMLGEATLKAVGCAHPGCTTPYEEHTWDNVLFLQLTRDCKHSELNELVKRVKLGDAMTADQLDGLAFVESSFQIEQDNPEPAKPDDPVNKGESDGQAPM